MHVAVAFDLRPGEQLGPRPPGQRERGGVEAMRRNRTKIDDFGTVGACLVHDHEPDPAEAAVPRLDGRESKSGGDDSVHRTATRFEHFGADLGRSSALRGDDTAPCGRGRLADVPVLRQMHGAGRSVERDRVDPIGIEGVIAGEP